MRLAIALACFVMCGLVGLVTGWFVGQGLEVSGVMDAETVWHTDPENVWAWSAILGAILGSRLGLAGLMQFKRRRSP
jgi:hypothetical protein